MGSVYETEIIKKERSILQGITQELNGLETEINWTPAEMGRKGGKKSRRKLSKKQAQEMVRKREEKRKAKLKRGR